MIRTLLAVLVLAACVGRVAGQGKVEKIPEEKTTPRLLAQLGHSKSTVFLAWSGDDGKWLASGERAKIPLQSARPLVLRCTLQDDVKVRDHLNLSKRVNERLREASAKGRGASLVFIDAEELPGALELAGRYRVSKDTVQVNLTLFQGDKEITRLTVEGSSKDLDTLAATIVQRVEQGLAKAKAMESSPVPG